MATGQPEIKEIFRNNEPNALPSTRKSFRTGDNAAIGRFVLGLPKGSAFVVQNRGSKTVIAVWNNPADVPSNVRRQ